MVDLRTSQAQMLCLDIALKLQPYSLATPLFQMFGHARDESLLPNSPSAPYI